MCGACTVLVDGESALASSSARCRSRPTPCGAGSPVVGGSRGRDLSASVLGFVAVAALLVITPGADTLLVVRNVLGRGRGAGLATTAGIAAGCFVHAGLSALGCRQSCALGGDVRGRAPGRRRLSVCWTALARGVAIDHASPDPAEAPVRRSFSEGALTNVLNPKVAIFYLRSCRSSCARRMRSSRGRCCWPPFTWLGIVCSRCIARLGSMARFVTAVRLRQRLEAVTVSCLQLPAAGRAARRRRRWRRRSTRPSRNPRAPGSARRVAAFTPRRRPSAGASGNARPARRAHLARKTSSAPATGRAREQPALIASALPGSMAMRGMAPAAAEHSSMTRRMVPPRS